MGVESVPLLAAIISSLSAILKTIWDGIKARALQLAAWFGLFLPWVVRQFGKYWYVKGILLGVAVSGLRAVFRSVFGLLNSSFDFTDNLFAVMQDHPWVLNVLFHGPLALDVLMERLFDVLNTFLSLVSLRVLITRSFYVFEMFKRLIGVSGR